VPSAEVLLMLLAAGLYIYDSALMLYANEAVLMRRGGRWTASFGSDRARLLNRELLFPDLLAPHRPAFRLSWRFEGDGANAASIAWTRLADALRPPALLIWAMAAALFALLPAGLFSRLGSPLVFAAVGVLYGSIAATLVWLYRKRNDLALEGRRFAALAFEALVCPPLALNLLRKVAATQVIDEPFPSAAQRLLTREDWEAARRECLTRLDDEIAGEDEASARYAALAAARERLLAKAGS
jgi:hypothetical protein